MTQFGSGWGWLAVKDGKLEVMKTPNGENPLVHGGKPILGCRRVGALLLHRLPQPAAEYLKALFDNLVNWEHVEEMFDSAPQ